MIASLPFPVTIGYLPLPAQQGSAPQIGVVPPTDPAGNQQQQPLQSVHEASSGSGLHTHDEASPPPVPLEAVPLLAVPLEAVPLLAVPLEAVPLLAVPLEAVPLLPVPLLPVDPLEPDPLSSVEGPAGPVELLLQAARPTVDDAPMTTMAWKSFSIFMEHTLSPHG